MRQSLDQIGKRAIAYVQDILEIRNVKLKPTITLDNDNRSIIQIIGNEGLLFENYSPHEIVRFLRQNKLLEELK